MRPTEARTALERCVGDAGGFLEQFWGTAPLLRAFGDSDRFRDLLSIEDADLILSTFTFDPGGLRLVRDGAPIPTSAYTRAAGAGAGSALDAVRVFQEFARGATIGFQSLQLSWPTLASFCRELEAELGHPAQTNAYLTPPGRQGLAMHRDDHHVFAVQLAGTKRWRVFARGATLDHPGTPLVEATLAAGDCLYIPADFLHVAEALDDVSLHLAVGVRPYTWRRALRELEILAEEDGAFGGPLPLRFATERAALEGGVEAWLDELRGWLENVDRGRLADRLRRVFLTRRPPALSGQLFRVAAAWSLRDDTVVRVRPGSAWAVEHAGEEELSLLLADRELRMPAWVSPALEVLLRGEAVRVGDLEPHLDPDSRLVLVRRLIGEGLVEVVAPPPEA